jgi:hypothetical protein
VSGEQVDAAMAGERTGAPTDLAAAMPATAVPASPLGSDAGAPVDPLAGFDAERMAALAAVADHLIPAAHGMPSAAQVIGEARLRFVLTARPDLVDPLRAALDPGLGGDAAGRLAALEQEPEHLAALQLTIVGGYYTDKRVRELIGYPGQEAIEVKSWQYPQYLEEGLIDKVLARGPVWRDPATGRRAVAGEARTETGRTWPSGPGAGEGGRDGHDDH